MDRIETPESGSQAPREARPWRLIARPFGLLFIAVDQLWGRRLLLVVIGGLALLFVLVDVGRLAARREIAALFKPSESRRVSSMSWFLAAIFLSFLAFPGPIPGLALCYATIGDACGKLVGRRFGRHRLLRSRTLEGSLAFFAGGFAAGLLLSPVLHASLPEVAVGSLCAAAVELFSERIDDNFSVPLLSGGCLYALRYFTGL